jgi:hypothetical protein
MDIDIRVDGVSITNHVLFARTRFEGLADGNPGSATVAIDNTKRPFGASDLHAGLTLELYIDGAREWDGWIMGRSRGWPFEVEDTTDPATAPRFWSLLGVDRNILFQKRVAYDVADPANRNGLRIWPAGTSDLDALTYAIEHYVDLSGDDLGVDIREIASPSPWEEFTLGFVSAPMGILFEDCAEMTGGVYWIGPGRIIHYRSDLDITAPFALTDQPSGSGEVGYRDAVVGYDYSQAATEALVWGAGKGSPDPVFARYTNETARDTYGLWQWGDLYVGAWKEETVERRARTYVLGSPTHRRGHDDPVPSVTCAIFEQGLRVGHVVDFTSVVHEAHHVLPVRKSTITFPTPDHARWDLELTLKVDTPWGVPDPWPSQPPHHERHTPRPVGNDITTCGYALIDHFDRGLQFAAAYTYHRTLLDYGSPITIEHVVSIPTVDEGDYIVVATSVNQGYMRADMVPLGWDLLDQYSFFTEGLGYTTLTVGRACDGTESETMSLYFDAQGDLIPADADITTHVIVYRDVAEYVVHGSYDEGPLEWPWSSAARVLSISRSGSVETPGTILATPPDGTSPPPLATTSPLYTLAQWAYGGSIEPPAPLCIAFRIKEADLGLGVTPGPEETGSAYPGGNEYETSGSGPGQWRIEDSCNVLDSGNRYQSFSLRGSEYALPSGEVVVEEPESAWDGGRWIHRSRVGFLGVDTQKDHYFTVITNAIDPGRMVGWDVECTVRYRHDEGWTLYLDPAAIEGTEESYSGPIEGLAAPSDPDSWYFIVVDFGVSGQTRMKIWLESDPEPEEWTASFPNHEYSLVDGLGFWGGASSAYTIYNVQMFNHMISGDTQTALKWDAHWSWECAGAYFDPTVFDIPVFVGASGEQASTYVTDYPYLAGSLRVWLDGAELRRNVDFVEVDPGDGTFRVMEGHDLSAHLTVEYLRRGSVPDYSGGNVYRPAPQLQYGWGTRFDGYNCTMACSAMALDRHTLGQNTAYQGSPRNIPPNHRAYQDDQSEGTDVYDAATAWDRGWGETLQHVGTTSWADFVSKINEGRGAILQGIYGWMTQSKRFSSYALGHAIYINEQFSNGNFWGIDPLYRYPVVYTSADLQGFAIGAVSEDLVSAAFTRVTT